MCNYSFFVGIDVSKAVIDVSYYHNSKAIYLGQYFNSVEGFHSMYNDLSKINGGPSMEWFICFENTGSYSKRLFSWLVSQGIPCREENALEISLSLGMRRGKDDKIDSKAICNYVYEKRDKMKPSTLSKPLIIKLKSLLSRRELLVKHRTALKMSVKEQKSSLEERFYQELEASNNEIVTYYDGQIEQIENMIQQLIKSNPGTNKNNELLQTITGIGPVTSAYLISTTNNFESFTNSRKYACYCGVAPFPNSSGIRVGKTKVNHMANKKMKSIFSNCIAAAIAHDPEISLYFKRKRNEGKKYGVVANAIKNKLIHRAFAVIKRQTPYVKMMNYV